MEDQTVASDEQVIAATKCRLCGETFHERVHMDDLGVFWKLSRDSSGENATPWCPDCLRRITQTFEALCAGINMPAEDAAFPAE